MNTQIRKRLFRIVMGLAAFLLFAALVSPNVTFAFDPDGCNAGGCHTPLPNRSPRFDLNEARRWFDLFDYWDELERLREARRYVEELESEEEESIPWCSVDQNMCEEDEGDYGDDGGGS